MTEQTPGAAATATRRVTLRALPIGEAVAVGTLAERMRVEPVQVIKQLMRAGVFASINQIVDFETAAGVARAFGYAARKVEDAASAAGSVAEDESADLETRPPVVTVLGTSTTAKRRCWTRCAARTSWRKRQAASRSTSARIRWRITARPSRS